MRCAIDSGVSVNASRRECPAISEYALLSDCHAPALVSRAGSVDWWCPPRADGPSVFGRLLDPDAGHWALSVRDPAEIVRSYRDDTLVLETTITTATGQVRLREALALEPGAREHDIGKRSPQLLVRTIEGLAGRVHIDCEFAPRIEYGLTTPHLQGDAHAIVAEGGSVRLRLTTPVELHIQGATATGGFLVEQGQRLAFACAYTPLHTEAQATRLDPVEVLEATVQGWESWVGSHTPYEGRDAAVVGRSAIVLQGLTYQPTGAILAAATTSLPAEIGGTDNWDYRYAWLRDLSLTTQALWIAACPDEASRFLRFIADAAGQPAQDDRVQIMYGIDGRRQLHEHTLPHLRGYAGSTPVRIGNAAWNQSQLDVMGEVLDMALRFRDQLHTMGDRTKKLLVWMADEAARTWQSPDAGMWEARDAERHYTTSKVMCWVALDRAVQLSDLLDAEDKAEQWQKTAAEIHATVVDRAWNDEVGAFTGAFGSERLDASVLLMPLIGFIDAHDQRMLATIDAVSEKLLDDGLVYRWAGDANGFVLCTAWLVECLAMAGRHDAARVLFDRLLARANDIGLFAEQIVPNTGEHTGNFPQAFSHVGVINAAWRLEQTADHAGR